MAHIIPSGTLSACALQKYPFATEYFHVLFPT
nr:MAG TPA: hypothetical protein [Caudoviricetes sp.]